MLDIDLTPFPELLTERLVLRRVLPADVAELHFLRADPSVMTYLDREPDASQEATAQVLAAMDETWASNRGIVWAMSRPEDERMIGTVALWRIMPESHRAELGYTLHPDFQGQGLMTEALAAVLQYAFQRLKLHSLEANLNTENEASARLLKRFGFVQEAHFRENWYFRGRFIDSAIYCLLAPR